ncbi:hypothetical protein [Sphingobium sp. DN12]|uniref:hypothetical protein n=1 Tax=Sphingobium sp. DN12 TaxID=3378073 RepID=UPI003DA35F93
MSPIEKAARALCRAHGDDDEQVSGGAPRWTAFLPHLMAVIDALHEPDSVMKDAGSEIIRHVGEEESEAGHRSDAANVWRFMVDALHQNGRHKLAEIVARPHE